MASEAEEATVGIGLGPVLARGFATLRANFLPFFGAALITTGLPDLLLQNPDLFSIPPGVPEYLIWPLAIAIATLPLLGLFLLEGFVIRASILFMSGRRPEYGASALGALRLILPMTGIFLVTAVAVLGGLILAVIPGIMAYCALIVAIPALVEERSGVYDSLHRSSDLTRGSRWSVFGLVLITWVVALALTSLVRTMLGGSPFDAPPPGFSIATFAESITSAFTSLFTAVMTASLYVELRTVKEGATTDTLAAIFA